MVLKKKILITGASGFIGSFLVEEALQNGLQVYAGVRTSSNLEYLQHPDIQLLPLNLASEQGLAKTFADFHTAHGAFEYIIHNAGATQTRNKEEFYNVNYRYTKNLVRALASCRMPIEKFILVSTLATYGPGDSTQFKPIQQEDDELPLSTYAKSKMMADRCVRSFAKFPFVILKPTAVFGPRDKDFLRLFKMINSGFEISIGQHRQVISLIYVKDFARAAIMLLNTPIEGKTFLVSDRITYSKAELNHAIATQMQKKTVKMNIGLKPTQWAITAFEKLYTLGGSRPFLNSEKLAEMVGANWSCNGSPLWQTLDSAPQFSLHQAVAETLEWYRQKQWL